jgi:hypothetical protein
MVLSTREPLDSWAVKRCAAVQTPATADQQTKVACAANGCGHLE